MQSRGSFSSVFCYTHVHFPDLEIFKECAKVIVTPILVILESNIKTKYGEQLQPAAPNKRVKSLKSNKKSAHTVLAQGAGTAVLP